MRNYAISVTSQNAEGRFSSNHTSLPSLAVTQPLRNRLAWERDQRRLDSEAVAFLTNAHPCGRMAGHGRLAQECKRALPQLADCAAREGACRTASRPLAPSCHTFH